MTYSIHRSKLTESYSAKIKLPTLAPRIIVKKTSIKAIKRLSSFARALLENTSATYVNNSEVIHG